MKELDLVKIFRVLVTINFLTLIPYFFIDMNTLIQSEYDLILIIEETNITTLSVMFENIFFIVFMLMAVLIMNPLLFFFTKWSREFMVFIILFINVTSLLDAVGGGYQLISTWEEVLGELEVITTGAIIAMAYLTPLKDKFK